MGFPSIFKNRELLLQWRRRRPSCVQAAKTLSFRAPEGVVLFGPSSDESRCFTESSEEEGGDQSPEEETIIRDVMRSSERLFFEEPGECATSSLIAQSYVEEAKEKRSEGEKEEEESSPFKESVIVAMETKDPYRDFKRSMQEMVECYINYDDEEEGMKLKKNWEWLQELLGWYLKMNVDGNHGFILGAFVDLLVELYAKNFSSCGKSLLLTSSSSSSSYSSALSSLSSTTSPFSSSLVEIEEEQG